jgi:hypothetical protein
MRCIVYGLARKTATTKTTTATFAAATRASTTASATTVTATIATAAATALALGHEVNAGACGVRLALTATLCFVPKRIDTTLCAQVRIGAGLKVVIVMTRRARFVVARWAWTVVAWLAIVLTRWAIALRTVAVTVAIVVRAWAVRAETIG